EARDGGLGRQHPLDARGQPVEVPDRSPPRPRAATRALSGDRGRGRCGRLRERAPLAREARALLAERPGLRFGRVAEEYERVRPSYPASLVDQALSRAGAGAGDTVVEIGCGTGKLTRTLVERGVRVDDEVLWAGADERRDNISELWSWLCHHHELAVPEAAELFEDVEITREPSEQDVPLEDYLARIRTTNNYLRMDAGTQQRLEQAL